MEKKKEHSQYLVIISFDYFKHHKLRELNLESFDEPYWSCSMMIRINSWALLQFPKDSGDLRKYV